MTPTSTLVNKVWSFCRVLRDAGLSYGDYLEQLTRPDYLRPGLWNGRPFPGSLRLHHQP